MSVVSGQRAGRRIRALVAVASLVAGTAVIGIVGVGAGTAGAANAFMITAMQTNVQGTMNSVSCPSPGACVAVGTATGNAQMLLETLNNGTWTADILSSSTFPVEQLQGVWCSSTSNCVAVGEGGTTTQNEQPIVVTLSNGTVSITNTGLLPPGSNATSGDLDAISCLSITSCVAAGTFTAGGVGQALFATLASGQWSATSATNPTGATSVGATSIKCFSTTSCLAVGFWGTSSAVNPLLETLSGSTWTESTLGNAGDYLSSLSCPSAGSCIAVGEDTAGEVLANTLASGQWTRVIITPPSGILFQGVGGVSCASTVSTCTVVGHYATSATAPGNTLVLSSNSGAWTAYTGLDPSGTSGRGTAVDCPTAAACVGVGALTATANGSGTQVQEPMSIVEGSGGGGGGPSVGGDGSIFHGYYLVGSDGGVFTFGSAVFYGSTGSLKLNRPVIGITSMPNSSGYWLVASDGGVFTFGNGQFLGSIPGLGLAPAGSSSPRRLNAPIVGLVPSADGAGYFMVGSDGGVFAFGDATYEGSCPGIGGCAGTAVGVAPDSTGNGYYLLTSTGHIYAFGDAPVLGEPGTQAAPFTSLVRSPDGRGYWALDGFGAVYSFGDATYFGGLPFGSAYGFDPATAIFATKYGGGYWITTALGKVTAFGDAPGLGDMSGTRLNGPIIAASGY